MKNLLMIFLILLAFPAQADNAVFNRVINGGTLRCGYIVWQPYMMKDPNTGKLSGMSYDIFEALGKTLGLKIDWVSEVQSGQEAEALNSDKVDAVCSTVPSNSRSAKYMDYIDGYAYMPFYIYMKKGGKMVNNVADLNTAQMSVTGMDGDISLFAAEQYFPTAKKVAVPSSADPTSINLNVQMGKADFVVNDPASLAYFNAANGDQLIPILATKPLVTLKEGAAIKKGENNLRQTLNEGMELMLTSGLIDQILDKWDESQKLMKRRAMPWR